MRELYLTVGAPAIGKTHWIKKMGLQDYTVSSDEIRHISTIRLKSYGVHQDTQLKSVVGTTVLKIGMTVALNVTFMNLLLTQRYDYITRRL